MAVSNCDVERQASTSIIHGGKYLSFTLADETYGLEIIKVREIIGQAQITAVPQTPDYVLGVMNLRGQIILVVDLKRKFGIAEKEHHEQSCIVVVELDGKHKKRHVGIVVDSVDEVLDINAEDIEEVPEFGSAVNTEFIVGIGKMGASVKILLDIDKVLTLSDMMAIGQHSVE